MTTYILMFYLYTISTTMSGLLTTAEFTSKERCEDAAQKAKKAFESMYLKGYYICVQK